MFRYLLAFTSWFVDAVRQEIALEGRRHHTADGRLASCSLNGLCGSCRLVSGGHRKIKVSSEIHPFYCGLPLLKLLPSGGRFTPHIK